MNATLEIKSAVGRKITDPRTGEKVPSDRYVKKPKISFWLRRLKDGDVIEKKDEPVQPKKKNFKPKEKSGENK